MRTKQVPNVDSGASLPPSFWPPVFHMSHLTLPSQRLGSSYKIFPSFLLLRISSFSPYSPKDFEREKKKGGDGSKKEERSMKCAVELADSEADD